MNALERVSRRQLLGGAVALAATAMVPQRARADQFNTISGEQILLRLTELDELRQSITGPLLVPASFDYEQARRVWNPAIDRRPTAIAQCTSVADIQATIQFARQYNILTAVRCGGHNVGGTGMVDGGLTIDLSQFRGAEVDRRKRIARLKGGSLLSDLDRATVPLGLATTAGVVSHTGVGGLATALGQGRLGRKFGYTIDNIRAANVITADGELVRADAKTNSDLYWGIRGGGSNFGIVTEFELQLHEFDPNVTSFSYTYPANKAADLIKILFALGDKVPRETSLGASMGTNAEGQKTVSISGTHLGSTAATEKVLGRSLRPLGKPIGTRVATMDYARLQSIADGPRISTSAEYSRSGFFHRVDNHIAESIANYGVNHLIPGTSIRISQQGGRGNDLASTDTAFPHRDVLFQTTVDARWVDPADAARLRQFADDSWDVIGPMTNGGFYVNVAVDPSEAQVRRAYGGNYRKLVALKQKFDPDNFFRLNVNIDPNAA